ncbi:MAG TPA: prolipoprotein diacylglyceryl transferase [Xanthobacteraceae bacterium]|nr:prolipoprotein diacylglyceryl transferase [Xanthobacteraceae bacterium]
MSWLVIPYPQISPVAFHIGSLAIRWYALAYSGGLVAIWLIALALVKRDAYWNGLDRPKPASVDYLVLYILFGTAIGGRLGEALIKPAVYFSHPAEILEVWHGGGLFFGAMIGTGIAVWIFARRNQCSFWTALDICSPGAALGVGFGRLANFINTELWGRPSDVPWAMVFPGAGPLPRHPSQLYEAALEGFLLFVVLVFAIRAGALKRPGLAAGLFALGYSVTRFFCEFFKAPDPDLFSLSFLTMGMLLSIATGIASVWVTALAWRGRLGPRPAERPRTAT